MPVPLESVGNPPANRRCPTNFFASFERASTTPAVSMMVMTGGSLSFQIGSSTTVIVSRRTAALTVPRKRPCSSLSERASTTTQLLSGRFCDRRASPIHEAAFALRREEIAALRVRALLPEHAGTEHAASDDGARTVEQHEVAIAPRGIPKGALQQRVVPRAMLGRRLHERRHAEQQRVHGADTFVETRCDCSRYTRGLRALVLLELLTARGDAKEVEQDEGQRTEEREPEQIEPNSLPAIGAWAGRGQVHAPSGSEPGGIVTAMPIAW